MLKPGLCKKHKNGRALPEEFKMYFKVEFETVIRGHYVYNVDLILQCNLDTRAEAKEHDDNAIGTYRVKKQLDEKKTLAGHVPIELSRFMKNFLEVNTENKLFAQVTGKRKREVGVVPAKLFAFTTEMRNAKVLES